MSDISNRIAVAQAFYNDQYSLLNKYKGGCTAGFLAAVVQVESGGNFSSMGDGNWQTGVGLGEVGWFQVAGNVTPAQFGIDKSVAATPEGNVFINMLDYTVNAVRIVNNYPSYVSNGTPDQWMFARSIFAIGAGGTANFFNQAIKAGVVGTENPFTDVAAWVAANQSGQAASRFVDITTQWYIGQQIDPSWPGQPQTIPSYTAYSQPADAAPFIQDGTMASASSLLLIVGFAAAAYLLV